MLKPSFEQKRRYTRETNNSKKTPPSMFKLYWHLLNISATGPSFKNIFPNYYRAAQTVYVLLVRISLYWTRQNVRKIYRGNNFLFSQLVMQTFSAYIKGTNPFSPESKSVLYISQTLTCILKLSSKHKHKCDFSTIAWLKM